MSWFKEWFNTPYYHILYKDRDFVEAENFIRNLTQDLQLSKDAKIIDLACGKGRHSVFLQQLGYEVLGVDLSEESIEHNKQFETSSTETLKLTFEVHDMRNELYPNVSSEKVNAVFNLFTSFGYFDDDE
jgi:SAM-dependent methyltransferase